MEDMEVTNKTILITGGLGSFGSWLTHRFCTLDYDVTVLTRRNLKLEFDLPFKTITCDISSLESCQSAITSSYDIIIHMASMSDNFVEIHAEDALSVNALGTRSILETIKTMHPKRFICLSTVNVCGKHTGEISEQSDLNPNNYYGLAHLFAEYYVKQFHTNRQIPYVIIRLSKSYGYPRGHDSSKWCLILNDLSKSAFKDKNIELNRNGLTTRDFIWMGK